jgi:hypothetical protein
MKVKKIVEIIFFILLFAFSWWLMWKTFRINENGNLEIATKVWSDFGATIPLVRSFSYGINWPPQYPIFAGPPIRYHFVFYAIVGLLEKAGIPLDWALNSLSVVSFFFLLLIIYILAKVIFKSRFVSIIACILFLFNGSFAFIVFFKKYPLSIHTLTDILHHDSFLAFGPYYGNKIISAFWSLNIYTNQRHLALAYAVFLLLVLFIYQASKSNNRLGLNKTLLGGITVGIFPFIHLPVFAMMEITLFIFFVLYPHLRKNILAIIGISLILALPQIMYSGAGVSQAKLFHPGYLIENLDFLSFIKYWFLNLGLITILAPIGFLLAKRRQRKIILPFLAFFVIGNLFQFSPEIAGNHKFFNLFIIGADIFAAYSIYNLWKYSLIGKGIAIFYLILMTLSGVIDIFPIKNDGYAEIKDGKNNDVEQFIIKNTPKESVFINAFYTYDPASLAGRKIFLGWPYFSWSAGYDTDTRINLIKKIMKPSSLGNTCSLLRGEGVAYIEVQNPTSFGNIDINYSFFETNFRKIFSSLETNISIYDVDFSCKDK